MSNIIKRSYKVTGMTCSAWGKAAERAVKKLDGVTSQSVNIATEKATISQDSSKVKLIQIRSTIEKVGYKVLQKAKVKMQALVKIK